VGLGGWGGGGARGDKCPQYFFYLIFLGFWVETQIKNGLEWCRSIYVYQGLVETNLTPLSNLTLKTHSRSPPMLLAKLRLMSTEVVKIRVSLTVSLRLVSWEMRNIYPPLWSPGWTLFQRVYRAVTWRLSSTKPAAAERSTGKCVNYGGDPNPPLLWEECIPCQLGYPLCLYLPSPCTIHCCWKTVWASQLLKPTTTSQLRLSML